MANCAETVNSRRKLFWATQPDACGSETVCGFDCGSPGLSLIDQEGGTTIATDNWIRGLVINMLMTDGKEPDAPCGFRPGSQGGHWSSSYIDEGPTDIGTLMRTVPSSGTVNETVALVGAYAKATVQRLVERGVALSVDVQASYAGLGKVSLAITINGQGGDTAKVGLSGSRSENSWLWS